MLNSLYAPHAVSRLVGSVALGLLFVAGLASGAVAQTTMRNSISIGQNSHKGVGIDAFAKEVERRTNGRYKIQNFYSGSLGGERESIEAVQLGTQELTLKPLESNSLSISSPIGPSSTAWAWALSRNRNGMSRILASGTKLGIGPVEVKVSSCVPSCTA